MKVLLIGQPNVGKTTLFNYLAKKNQRVSNMAGTTVGTTSATFRLAWGKNLTLVDTPGLYSIYNTHSPSLTDQMVVREILDPRPKLILNVITSDNLYNGLNLTAQLLDLGIPTVVLINHVDNGAQNIDCPKLEARLGCRVLGLNFNRLQGQETKIWLQRILRIGKFSDSDACSQSLKGDLPTYHNQGSAGVKTPPNAETLTSGLFGAKSLKPTETPPGVEPFPRVDNNVNHLLKEININANYIPAPKQFYGLQIEKKLQKANTPAERYDILSNHRQAFKLHNVTANFVKRTLEASVNGPLSKKHKPTAILDAIFLNKFLGLPLFLLVMYLFFFLVINVSQVFQDFITTISGIFFVEIPTSFFAAHHINNVFSVVTISLGSSLQVLTPFLPILFLFYLCLDFLENSGYMSRGAYVTDSLMRLFGLPGKSLITMLIGFGCNVPAILATRTVSNKTERILTILASPFISCSARLTVYVLFVSVFFPKLGVQIIYFMFLMGLLIGIFTVWFFKKTLFDEKEAFFILELPRYRLPSLRRLVKNALFKVYQFMFKRVGKIIIPVMLVFYILHYAFSTSEGLKSSALVRGLYNSQLIFAPMGIAKDNWPATVALVGGVVAKEVVITTLQNLYMMDSSSNTAVVEPYTIKRFSQDIDASFSGLSEGLKQLASKLSFHSLRIDLNSEYYSRDLAQTMLSKFRGIPAAISYLLFIMIYTPCLITLGAVRKELSSKWMHFTNLWNIILAYIVSSCTFQILTYGAHPTFSSLWLLACLGCFVVTYLGLKYGKDRIITS